MPLPAVSKLPALTVIVMVEEVSACWSKFHLKLKGKKELEFLTSVNVVVFAPGDGEPPPEPARTKPLSLKPSRHATSLAKGTQLMNTPGAGVSLGFVLTNVD